MKIGIIGTSHSEGNIQYTGSVNRTLPFEKHLSNAMPNYDFINLAKAGRGSERYLECIVTAKDKYNVDAILIEYAADRTSNNYWYNESAIKKLTDAKKIANEIIEDTHCYIRSLQGIEKDNEGILKNIPQKKFKTFKEVNSIIFRESKYVNTMGIKNVYQCLQLCKLLDIKFIPWEYTYTKFPIKRKYVKTMLQYIKDNDLQHEVCDGYHSNDKVYNLAAYDLFKPLIAQCIK